jgi:hypothetical protein
MDPNLFHVDFERVGEVLVAIIVLAFFLERGLALLFEHRWYIKRLDQKGFKEPIAFLVALLICVTWQFDAVSAVILTEKTYFLGYLVTAGIIAGGSKAAIKLFHDVMGVKSSALQQREKESTVAEGSSGGGEGGKTPGNQG